MGKSKTSTFVKQLASNNRKTRDQALETLKKFLATRAESRPFTSLELQKLWKGLYFTMWYCDRPRPQQRLAEDLSSLFSKTIPPENFALFAQAFWVIMVKEWTNLDQWRIDKFYMLMRYVIRESFSKLQLSDWEDELVNSYVKVLDEGVLSGDEKNPNGIVYHIIDVWIDELEKVMFKDLTDEDESDSADEKGEDTIKMNRKEIISEVPVNKLLQPFERLRKDASMKTLRLKIRDDLLLDSRLDDWGIKTVESSKSNLSEDEGEWTGFGES